MEPREGFFAESRLYLNYGADATLAEAMAHVLNATSFAPINRTLDDRVNNARKVSEFEGLCLEFMLTEEPAKAKEYLKRALQVERSGEIKRAVVQWETRTSVQFIIYIELLLGDFDKAYEVMRKVPFEKIDKLRAKKGYGPVRQYIEAKEKVNI